MDGKFLPIQNRLIYSPSKVQSLSLPKYFFIIYKHPLKALHVFGYLAGYGNSYFLMTLVILCCRVQHNKLFHQQQQENDELHKLIIFLSQNNKLILYP